MAHTSAGEFRHDKAIKQLSTRTFTVWAEMSDGRKRHAFNVPAAELLAKLTEYRDAGAVRKGYEPTKRHKRTKWG